MKILFILISFSLFLTILIKFIKNLIRHRKRTSELESHALLQSYMIDWSKEIVNDEVRTEFVKECIDYIFDFTRYDKKFDINIEKKKIYDKWGKHIPSLLTEFREKKLNIILNKK